MAPVQLFIQQNAHSLICHSVRLRLLQQGKDLLLLYTGKTFEKVCYSVSGLKMVKQTLDRYPGPGKDRLASENFRVSPNDFLHGYSLAPAATLCEAKVFRQQLRKAATIGASPFVVSLNASTALELAARVRLNRRGYFLSRRARVQGPVSPTSPSSRRWPAQSRPANLPGGNGPPRPSPPSELVTCGRSREPRRWRGTHRALP
jgi:hypothetical protein